MFKFNFEVDESDDPLADLAFGPVATAGSAGDQQRTRAEEDRSTEIPIKDLVSLPHMYTNSTWRVSNRYTSQIAALPHIFSYSPLAVVLASKRDVVLARRDLFDAKFQLIASDEGTEAANGLSDVDFLDAPSDLVPWVYEGGLKTWECSLDLVDCLDTIYGPGIARNLRQKRILEARSQ